MLRSPALHFVLLGALLFALFGRTAETAAPERARLVIPRSRIELAVNDVVAAVRRPLQPAEERAIVDGLIDDEILYRYALALGLERAPVAERRLAQVAAFVDGNQHAHAEQAERAAEAVRLGLRDGDVVVRRILVDGAKRIIRAVMLTREPTEEMLEAYLRGHPAEFEVPERVRFAQVVVNRLRHGADTEAQAEALLAHLVATAAPPEVAAEVGDRVFVPPLLPLLTEHDLARRFGVGFVDGLRIAPQGRWSGPIRSRYGLHLVHVQEREAAYVPALAQVRDRVRRRLQIKLADEWLALRLQQLRAEFEIVVPGGAA
jgi:hypothetical protein